MEDVVVSSGAAAPRRVRYICSNRVDLFRQAIAKGSNLCGSCFTFSLFASTQFAPWLDHFIRNDYQKNYAVSMASYINGRTTCTDECDLVDLAANPPEGVSVEDANDFKR